jgi:hypothetical protein
MPTAKTTPKAKSPSNAKAEGTPKPKAKKPPKVVEPDDLVRETAGSYVSGDSRFEVRQSDANWYLVDREQSNEFGQELIHGPFSSMKAAKAQMRGARDIKPLLRSTPRPKRMTQPKPAPQPKQTWIDKLSRDEATQVRKQLRALEGEGVSDAESLVRKDRDSLAPAIAQELLDRRLAALIEDLPEKDRATAKKLIARLAEAISDSGAMPDPLPGWALFETGPGREPTKRRVRPNG